MTVLVATASRHGSTSGIGDAVAVALRETGLTVDVRDAAAVDGVTGYEAAVLGSGVYLGRWLPPARDLVSRYERDLAAIPVWLISSGPLGDPPHPVEEPVDAAELAARIGARGHVVFAGRLERTELGLGERAVIRVVKAPYGDYRAWEDIRAWAEAIAAEIGEVAARPERPPARSPTSTTMNDQER